MEDTINATEAQTPDFELLDPRVIQVWRVQRLVGLAVQMGMAVVVGLILMAALKPSVPWVIAFWTFLVVVNLGALAWYPTRAWQMWGYRVNAQVLETRYGVWWQTAQMLPLSRLQHVDLHRGPIDRYFGLTSLILYTAGTQHSMIVIPGLELEGATRLRDRLAANLAETGGDDGV